VRVARDDPEPPDVCRELRRCLLVSALDQRAGRRGERFSLRGDLVRPTVFAGEHRTARGGRKSPPHLAGTLQKAPCDTVNADLLPDDPVLPSATNCEVVNKL
jgi:hypothetical protein